MWVNSTVFIFFFLYPRRLVLRSAQQKVGVRCNKCHPPRGTRASPPSSLPFDPPDTPHLPTSRPIVLHIPDRNNYLVSTVSKIGIQHKPIPIPSFPLPPPLFSPPLPPRTTSVDTFLAHPSSSENAQTSLESTGRVVARRFDLSSPVRSPTRSPTTPGLRPPSFLLPPPRRVFAFCGRPCVPCVPARHPKRARGTL